MFPTICNGLCTNCIPCLPHHQHDFQQVYLINIFLPCFIHVNCMSTEGLPIVCLETTNDPSIERLNVGGEVGLKEYEFDVGRLICDLMTSKVIECQCNMPILAPELLVKFLDPFFEKFCSHPCCLVVTITKTILGWLLLETSRLLRFPDVKDRPFLSAGLVANKCDSNSEFIWFLAGHLLWCYPSIWRSDRWAL